MHDNEVSLSTINNSNIIDAWNTVSSKKSKKTEQQKYGNFLKTSTLHNGCLIQDTSIEKEEETAKDSIYIPLSDEQLYKACSDRTARHGLTLNGKLARIAQQDRIFLDVNIGGVCQLDTSLVKKNTMTHRKTDVELDTEESEDPEDLQEIVDDQNTSEHETKDFVIRSKSARKSHKKRINKFIQQFSICSLKGKTDSEYNSLHDGESARFKKEKECKSQLNIKSGKCSKKKKKNRRKRSFEQEIQRNAYNILYKTSNIRDKLNDTTEDVYLSKSKKSDLQQKMYICQSQRSPFTSSSNDLNDKVEKDIGKIMLPIDKEIRNIQQQIQEQATWTRWMYFDVGERDFKPSMKKFYSLYYDKLDTSPKISFYKSLSISSTKDQSHINNSDDKLHNKDKKIKKKAHQQKQVKKQLEKVINPVNFCTDDLNTVIKKLTTFDLTEKVSANAFKKKLTQTHLTPV